MSILKMKQQQHDINLRRTRKKTKTISLVSFMQEKAKEHILSSFAKNYK